MKRTEKRIKATSSRKGISLVEVVVALAIIAIISTAAFSLMVLSANIEADAVRTTSISAAADDVLDCFRYAEDETEFYATLCKLDAYERSEAWKYVLNKPTYTLYINVEDGKLSFTAYETEDGETGDLIYSYEYKKG